MAYIGTSPSNGVRRRFVYEATASQTSFSGSDENGVTLTYVDSLYLDVFQNGIKLKAGDDYTATTGTTVVLVQGASANDVVEMVAFDVFSVGDTVSAKDGGSFAGTVGFGAGIAGGVVFNEAGADVDFRVESDANANMLFVDGGANSVGIGERTSSFTYPLEVQKADNAYIRIASGTSQENAGILLSNQNTLKWTIEKVGAAHDFYIHNAGGDTALKIDQNRTVTLPGQPAFLAHPASNQADIAVGSDVTVAFGTEIFDQNADFASNTFTAPVTGKYQLNLNLELYQIDSAASYYQAKIVTSNRTYTSSVDMDYGQDNTFDQIIVSVLADMDAADTASIAITQTAGSAQTDVLTNSHFSGYLVA